MPELPEVEVVRQSLEPLLLNQTIKALEVFYQGAFKSAVSKELPLNKKIIAIKRRGKYLFMILGGKGVIVVHLRMTGKLIYRETDRPTKHDHVRLTLDRGYLYYNDVRKFGGLVYYATEDEAMQALKHLGKEPFDESLTASYLFDCAKNKKRPLKSFLLDQAVIAGIGNIYADEILFQAKLSPLKPCSLVSPEEWESVISAMRDILGEAIALGGSSIKDYIDALGKAGTYQNRHKVYGMAGEACKVCNTMLLKTKIGGRTSVYCPNCQK